MKFKVEWELLAYDAFDTIDSVISMTDLSIEAADIEAAKKIANKACVATIDATKPDKTSGIFIQRLISLTDQAGNKTVLNKPLKIGDNNTLVELDQ